MTSPAPVAPPPGRIVVGVDGSTCSARALEWSLRQAVLTGAGVEAVACWQVPALSGTGGYGAYLDVSTSDLTGDEAGVLDNAVAAAVGDVPGAGAVTVSTCVVQGYPPRALLQVAEGADLLVVGSRGHSALAGLVLGSVGLHCVTHAGCPVAVVHEPPASEDSR